MIFDDVIVPLVSGAAGAMALRLVLAAVETLRAPKAPPSSPASTLGMTVSGPYRALAEAGPPDHAQLALDLADEAVRRERARVLAIVTATEEASDYGTVKAATRAIANGIMGGK